MFILARIARLGFVADLLSQPVLIGYLAGVALIMMVDQLTKLTGVETQGSHFFPQLISFLRNISQAQAATVVLSIATLLFLFLAAAYLPRGVPVPLLAVVLGTAVTAGFGLDSHGIAVIGEIPTGLPHFSVPSLSGLKELALPAIGVLLVGYTDVILTARAFESRSSGERLDPDQELLALGVVNLGTGVLHGFPVSSSASRTTLAKSAGAHSQLYGLAADAVVVGVLLFLGPALAHTPSAVLGCLVVFAATRMIDIAGFRRLASFRSRELLLGLGCLVGVLALDILYGVLVAVGLSVAELLTRVARPHDAVLGLVPGVPGMHDIDDYPQARTVPGLLIYRYDSPLFFANAEDFRRRALAVVDEQPEPVRWFVLNTEANVEVDITALDSLEALREELARRGIVFAAARVKQDLREELDAYGLTRSIGEDRLFATLPAAVAAYRSWENGNGNGNADGAEA